MGDHKLAKDATRKSKAFFQYVNSKTKQVVSISNLLKADGTLTEKEKAEMLNAIFGSVFNSDEITNIQNFNHVRGT